MRYLWPPLIMRLKMRQRNERIELTSSNLTSDPIKAELVAISRRIYSYVTEWHITVIDLWADS